MADEIKIESGIPMPPGGNRGGRRRTTPYKFDEMKVGDSFAVEAKGDRKKAASGVYQAYRRRMELYPTERYAHRLLLEGAEGEKKLMVRVWRMPDKPDEPVS